MNHNISVVTVCFNAEKEIEKTVASVLSQDYDNYNYYIIDGNSSDRTIEIVETVSSNYPLKPIIISEPDKGIYAVSEKVHRTGSFN